MLSIVVTYIFSFRIEPVGDVASCSEDDWVALWTSGVLVYEEGQIEDLVEEGDPAVSLGVVHSDFLWSVEATELVGSWDVLGFLDFGRT